MTSQQSNHVYISGAKVNALEECGIELAQDQWNLTEAHA